MAEVDRHAAAEAGPDLAHVHETSRVVVHSEEQRTDAGAAALGIGEAADHELLLLDALRLQPAPAAARPVRRVPALRDHALERHAARLPEERLAASHHVIAVAQRWSGIAGLEQGAQRLLALHERNLGEVVAIEVQQVEDEVDGLVAPVSAERVL